MDIAPYLTPEVFVASTTISDKMVRTIEESVNWVLDSIQMPHIQHRDFDIEELQNMYVSISRKVEELRALVPTGGIKF